LSLPVTALLFTPRTNDTIHSMGIMDEKLRRLRASEPAKPALSEAGREIPSEARDFI
jgi:hypothetical protein